MGPLTIRAGETFTQALMGRTPHVTRIGENTQGVFSDVLVRKLTMGGFSVCRTRCIERRKELRSMGRSFSRYCSAGVFRLVRVGGERPRNGTGTSNSAQQVRLWHP
jgi:hypothetical protein